MADIPFLASNGLGTAFDELRTPSGFVRRCVNAILKPDDPDRLWKISGRTYCGLPSATTPYGLVHCQFDSGVDYLVALANSKLYRGEAAASQSTWTALEDVQSPTPADYSVTGTFLKAVHDMRDYWVLTTGQSSARPFLLDADGNARFMGMLSPDAPTLTAISGVGTPESPNTASGSDFAALTDAYDDDETTKATSTRTADTGTKTTTFSWTGAALATGTWTLKAKVASRGTSTGGITMPGSKYPREEEEESSSSTIKVEVTTNLTAGTPTWVTIGEHTDNATATWYTYDIAAVASPATDRDDLGVKVTHTSSGASSSTPAYGYIYEVVLAPAGGTTTVASGTYYYAVTEVYRKTLTDGSSIEVESSVGQTTQLASIALAAPNTGCTVTLPTRVNLATHGFTDASLFFRVYRSTSTGTWPDLGLIGQTTINSTTFTDNFDIAGTDLDTDSTLPTVDVGGYFYAANDPPPPLYDICAYKSMLVGVPAGDRHSIVWSRPGGPEYWPACHQLSVWPDERNDEIQAIASIGSYLLIFFRTRVIRVRDLPIAGSEQTFDLMSLDKDILSPHEGLVGRDAWAYLTAQSGAPAVIWCSDNGLWMTDGSIPEERGLGCMKLTQTLNWPLYVYRPSLSSAHLSYDPVDQVLRFSYISLAPTARPLEDTPTAGNRQELWLHTAPQHWLGSGSSQATPKITGPHDIRNIQYALGELSGQLALWGLESSTGKIWYERDGMADNAHWSTGDDDIFTLIDWGWTYPGAAQTAFHARTAIVSHNDWGPAQACDLRVDTRTDLTGIIQSVNKTGINLHGARTNQVYINRAGDCLRLQLTHTGQASGAIGPITVSGEIMDRR